MKVVKNFYNLVHGEKIHGIEVDEQTRCKHWHSEFDVIAIKFKCCCDWFPCFECHRECTTHRAEVWKSSEFETKAILCGVCGEPLTISEYMNCGNICPNCNANFNPGCANHYDLYFEV
jgi:uncharacterized CHY-type Zn-finger protein